MSIPLPFINLAGVAAGQQKQLDLSAVTSQLAYATNERPAHLRVYNESGVGISVQIGADRGDYIPAGSWPVYALGAHDDQVTLTFNSILGNAQITQVQATFYKPGESVPDIVLGNSPAGIAGSVPSAVTQVIQDGQALPTIVLEATPSGHTSLAKINNDGSGYLSNAAIQFDGAGNLTLAAGSETITSPASTTAALLAFLPGAPATDRAVILVRVTGDASNRADLYVQTVGGYGGFRAGAGGAGGITAHLDGGPNGWAIREALTSLGGQASVGSFGAPVIVAQALNQHVTATTVQTIVNFTPSVTGLYRISGYVTLNNGTSGQLVQCQAVWTDANTVLGFTGFFSSNGTPLSGSNSFLNAGLSLSPLVVYASAGHPISLTYQDPANTPSDFISALIERLA